MQKAHSRINWENEPSLNTPLGANNLNKMDKAIDVIDDRVLSLYGYEGRVAQSEKNAKASEVNAKSSETNAKQSELKTKEYMENAFSGTPEGYEKLVEDVRLMDIQTTTDTTLLNSKSGGYKLISMSGKSVQNGTPTPDAPQSIHNVGDCVEMMQGAYGTTNGVYGANEQYVCSKNGVPCKSGDVINVSGENVEKAHAIFYNKSGFVSALSLTGVSGTTPSGATYFKINIYNANGITPDTVGKISLTINGKYVVQIPIENKNLLLIADQTQTFNGILTTVKDNVFSSSGTATRNGGRTTYFGYCYLPKGTYYLSTQEVSGVIQQTCLTNVATGSMIASNNAKFTLTEDTLVGLGFNFTLDVTYNCTFKIQLERGEVMTEWVEPKKTVTTVLLNEPLRESDVMSRMEVARKRASKTYNGSESAWKSYGSNRSGLFGIARTDAKKEQLVHCTHYKKSSAPNSYDNLCCGIDQYGNFWIVDTQFNDSVDELKAWLTENPITIEYELAEEVIENLDTDSQIALNSLETFDTVTYINVDSRVQPSEIKGEYGTSMVGARTIKNDLRNDTLEIKYNELAVALVATESGV